MDQQSFQQHMQMHLYMHSQQQQGKSLLRANTVLKPLTGVLIKYSRQFATDFNRLLEQLLVSFVRSGSIARGVRLEKLSTGICKINKQKETVLKQPLEQRCCSKI